MLTSAAASDLDPDDKSCAAQDLGSTSGFWCFSGTGFLLERRQLATRLASKASIPERVLRVRLPLFPLFHTRTGIIAPNWKDGNRRSGLFGRQVYPIGYCGFDSHSFRFEPEWMMLTPSRSAQHARHSKFGFWLILLLSTGYPQLWKTFLAVW